MLLLDREAALAAIPKLLPDDINRRSTAFKAMSEVLSASEEITGERAAACSVSRHCSALMPANAGEGVEYCPFRSQGEGVVTQVGRSGHMSADATQTQAPSKYDRLIAAAKAVPPTPTIVVHPCDETSLRGALESAQAGIIRPILVGPGTKIRDTASRHGLDIGAFEIVDTSA